MASIAVRGKSLYIHYSVSGTLYRKPLKLKNNKKNMLLALNKAYEIEEMIDNHILPTDADLIIERTTTEKIEFGKSFFTNQSLYEYLNNYTSNMPKSKNKLMFDAAIKKFNALFDTKEMKLHQVTEIIANTYKENLLTTMAYSSVRTYMNYMRIIFNSFIKSKIYTEENPFKRLKRKDAKYIVTIPDEHLDLILNYMKDYKPELYRLLFFLKQTGFRLGEAVSLTWEQIKWKENVIDMVTHKDNNRSDLFPLNINNGVLKDFLLSFKLESGKIFNVNQHYVLEEFQRTINKINKEYSKEDSNFKKLPKYTIHQFRKTAISRWAKILSPMELTTLARHKDVSTTMRYYINIGVNDIANKINAYKG